MHLPAVGTDAFDNAGLDRLVDVLAVGQRAVAVDLDRVEGGQDLAGDVVVDDSLLGEHHDVCTVDLEVRLENSFVGRKRGAAGRR